MRQPAILHITSNNPLPVHNANFVVPAEVVLQAWLAKLSLSASEKLEFSYPGGVHFWQFRHSGQTEC